MHINRGLSPHINWYIVFSAMLSMIFSLFVRGNSSVTSLNWLNLLHTPLITLLPVAAYMLIERPNAFSLGITRLHRRYVLPILFMALGVWALSQMCGAFVDSVLGQYGITTPKQVDVPATFSQAMLGFLAVCVIAPLCEEFLYRGVVLHAFKGYGFGGAVLSSAIMFAIAHYNPSLSAVALIFGVFTGYAVLATGSLFAGVLLHAVCNTLSYIFMAITNVLGLDFGGFWLYGILALTLPLGILWLGRGHIMSRGATLKGLGYLVLNLPFILLILLYIISIPFGGGLKNG